MVWYKLSISFESLKSSISEKCDSIVFWEIVSELHVNNIYFEVESLQLAFKMLSFYRGSLEFVGTIFGIETNVLRDVPMRASRFVAINAQRPVCAS